MRWLSGEVDDSSAAAWSASVFKPSSTAVGASDYDGVLLALSHAESPTHIAKPVKPGLRDSVVELSEENMQLKAHVAELEEARTKEPLEFTLGEVRVHTYAA